MSMSYTIDPVRRLVLTRGWGIVTTSEMQELMTRMLADPNFSSEYNSLADLTDVTDVTIEAGAMMSAATMPLHQVGTRRAIVAPSDIVFGSARMFAVHAERNGQVVRVFRDLAEAEAWLVG